MATTNTQICIQDLAAYNNGFLVFEWVQLPIGEEELQGAITKVLAKGEELCSNGVHEEIMLADFESDIISINEWSNPFQINEICEELEALEEYELKKYKYLVDSVGYNHEEAMRHLDNCDLYENMNLKELAEQFIEEGLFGNIPDSIKNYLDYDAIARDLAFDYTEYDGDIYRAS